MRHDLIAMPKAAYQDPRRSVSERVADLLSRMTLEEKVGQMMQLDGRGPLEPMILDHHVGSLLHILNERLNEAIDLVGCTRLRIPLLIGDDGIHGHSFHPGATIFPTQLGMAASWNPELMQRVARAAAREMAATGMHWTFSPVLCLARDLRWGRINETFGEDPFLIGEFSEAFIHGYQGRGLDDHEGVMATAKHFAGYSETQGGRDASEADLSRRKLRSYFLPPFERAARAGCMAFMTGYQSIEGVPSTCNRWLLTDVLRGEWDFDGILVTDWDNVGRLVNEQKVCADLREAAVRAIRAGNDLIMATPGFFDAAREAVRDGLLREEEIDKVVSRILALKFRLGLFENPRRPDRAGQAAIISCPEHRALNLEMARESMVLLRNEGVLPLSAERIRTIAVIGPNADDPMAQLGDWSLGSTQVESPPGGHPRECTTTVLDGLRRHSPAGIRVLHAPGCSIDDKSIDGIAAAVEIAQKADVVVVAVGDHLPLTGEYNSTATLELQGGQTALIEALVATGTPMVVVLISGKPLVLPRSATSAAAVLAAFNPGMEGGRALAEILWGTVNPSGRLTISFPRHVGQQPVFYSQVRGQHGDRYADLTQEPQYVFGEGLGYTSFEIRDLIPAREVLRPGESLDVDVVVANTGTRQGATVVQIYVEDLVTSVTWVHHALFGFAKVALAPGEERRVRITLPPDAFSLVDAEGCRVTEPGGFRIGAGFSSRRDGWRTTIVEVV